ncbi:FxLYD domain-containing protein [Actinoplanes sp. CA-131856]
MAGGAVPPTYGPPPGYPAPHFFGPPPKKNFWSTPGGIVLIVVGAVVLGCLGLGVIGSIGSTGSRDNANLETAVVGCEFTGDDVLPSAKITFTVKNNGKSAHGATVRIEYRDAAGNRIDTDTSYVKSIAPGDTVKAEETTLLDAAISGSGTCGITGVS